MNAAEISKAAVTPVAQELLADELDTYQRELPRLLNAGEKGRWVVVKSSAVIGVWDTFGDAVEAGYGRFGQEPFLVQQVLTEQPVAQQPWQRA